MTSKKTVLDGHKRKGSKFIPPMMQVPTELKEISYVNQILPEIIWMGLVNDRVGYKKGIDLSTKLAEIAFGLKSTENHVNFSLVSNFNLLSNVAKKRLVEILERNSTLSGYHYYLSPLIELYKDFPLSFLGKNKKPQPRSELIDILKKCIDRHFDKHQTPSLVIQANVVHLRSITGGLHFAKHIEEPDLNALIESPQSDKARRAGAFVRIHAMSELMPMGEDRLDDWSCSFWNQSYQLDSCDFLKEENELDE